MGDSSRGETEDPGDVCLRETGDVVETGVAEIGADASIAGRAVGHGIQSVLHPRQEVKRKKGAGVSRGREICGGSVTE